MTAAELYYANIIQEKEDRIKELERELKEAREQIDVLLKVAGECTWKEDDEGNWDTTCGEAFQFNDGTPSENSMKYCCYCGKPLKEVMWEEEEVL